MESFGELFMKKKIRFKNSVLVSCLLSVVILMSSASSIAAVKMPVFSLENVVGGDVVRSSSFDGQVVFITFFATWCPPCIQEVSVLKQLQEELNGRGFTVVALSVDQQGAGPVAAFVKSRKINYPVLMAEAATVRDFGGVYGIPVGFLVNRAGNVVKKYNGYVGHNILERDIKSLLN